MGGAARLFNHDRNDGREAGRRVEARHARAGRFELPEQSVFKEVVKPERIVYSHGGGRENGPGAQLLVSTWTFEEVGEDTTRLTMRLVFATPEERDFVVKEFGALEGGKQTLTRLASI